MRAFCDLLTQFCALSAAVVAFFTNSDSDCAAPSVGAMPPARATIDQAMTIACAALRYGATDAWLVDDDDKKVVDFKAIQKHCAGALRRICFPTRCGSLAALAHGDCRGMRCRSGPSIALKKSS
jgi:hypothetical protein